jgi:hypothetical protein
MKSERSFWNLSQKLPLLLFLSSVISISTVEHLFAQTKLIDGQNYTRYKPGLFKPKKGLDYTIYFSPVLTIDPLGVGGKSTYAIGAGTNVVLWESKSAANSLQGLKIQNFYMGLGYEYYPQQYDKLYISMGIRIKTFMPLAARMERFIDFGENAIGTSARFCFGFEIKKITIFLCGVSDYRVFSKDPTVFHPFVYSKYSNAGAILLVIPVYNHIGRFKK